VAPCGSGPAPHRLDKDDLYPALERPNDAAPAQTSFNYQIYCKNKIFFTFLCGSGYSKRNYVAPCGSDLAPAPHLLDGDLYPAPGRPNDAAPATPPTSYLAVFTPVDIVRSD
jgi:hypothetical protein